ncbi:Endoribonuclease L-PSP/chorismate mutase-like protein [Aspergillus pseudoustus]|uniref:Endoribonuclease L-PSP/chorismate mutase-like protein n=1 Tax=Aspergillus pseudoustus TaxID=1810923 RepID=A0ABR4L1P1_9EURO
MVEGTIADRTTQIMKNIGKILKAAGSSLENVVKISVFITDMHDFATMNEAYMRAFDKGVKPVRTCVAVKELPQGTDVEMEATAHL